MPCPARPSSHKHEDVPRENVTPECARDEHCQAIDPAADVDTLDTRPDAHGRRRRQCCVARATAFDTASTSGTAASTTAPLGRVTSINMNSGTPDAAAAGTIRKAGRSSVVGGQRSHYRRDARVLEPMPPNRANSISPRPGRHGSSTNCRQDVRPCGLSPLGNTPWSAYADVVRPSSTNPRAAPQPERRTASSDGLTCGPPPAGQWGQGRRGPKGSSWQ